MEYVKVFWQYIDNDTPVLMFVELNNERYSIREIDIFQDRHTETISEKGFETISKEPYPSNDEINNMDEFRIYNISKQEFEEVYKIPPKNYEGNIDFPT